MNDLAAAIRRARTDADLTQQTLATRANVALRTLVRIESGEGCTVAVVERLAAALGTSVGDLLGAEGATTA